METRGLVADYDAARPAHGLGRGQGEALQPHRDRPHARARAGRRSGSSRSTSAAASACAASSTPRTCSSRSRRAGSAARSSGSRIAPSTSWPRTTPASRCTRSRSPHGGGSPAHHARHLLVRSGRLRAHAGHPADGAPGAPPPGAVPLGRLLDRRPRRPHAPHAGRHVSRAGDDRGDVRARAHARPRRGRARARSRRAPAPQPRDARRMPFVYDLGPAAPPIVYESGDFPAFFERLLESGLRAPESGLRAPPCRRRGRRHRPLRRTWSSGRSARSRRRR